MTSTSTRFFQAIALAEYTTDAYTRLLAGITAVIDTVTTEDRVTLIQAVEESTAMLNIGLA